VRGEERNGSHRLGRTQAAREAFSALAEAAQDRKPVAGWTHNFYRYPARFSPRFAAAAIANFSRPGDLVLDPYMGGGTVLVEGLLAGRRVVGNDLNSLAAFVAKVKTRPLNSVEASALKHWAEEAVPTFQYHAPGEETAAYVDLQKVRNLQLPRARFIKKAIAVAIKSIHSLPTENAQDFARCVTLRVSQWALDGREGLTPLNGFRHKLTAATHEMLEALKVFGEHVESRRGSVTILNEDASTLDRLSFFRDARNRAALIVTSPPYPGVHVLYHRWQVDGRRETPAPYWITGCTDGQGASFYNFGDRRESAADDYFDASLRTLKAIRQVINSGGYMVQMVAFNRPAEQLPRYLENMRAAGFTELPASTVTTASQLARIWREVPNRKWHAALKGKTSSSSEVVLVHRAA
jgi:DNA modification methylase